MKAGRAEVSIVGEEVARLALVYIQVALPVPLNDCYWRPVLESVLPTHRSKIKLVRVFWVEGSTG